MFFSSRHLFLALFVTASFMAGCVLAQSDDDCGAPPSTGTCTATVRVQPTQPGHGSFMYNNIIVQNTGTCAILSAFVIVTLPPYAPVFAYYNMSNSTGELFGLSNPMTPGSSEVGGVIVLSSARTPLVSLGSVECDTSCSGEHSTRTVRSPIHPEAESTKLEVQLGANAWSIAIHLVGDSGATSEVRLSDAASVSQQLMKRENWGDKAVYTFSGVEMTLPLSLELTSIQNDKIVLKDIITTFSHVVLDTGLAYTHNQQNAITESDVTFQVHPHSDSNWIGIIPQSSHCITSMSIKSSNTEWVDMTQIVPGFFEFTSPETEIQLPVSVTITFGSGDTIVFENTISTFRQ